MHSQKTGMAAVKDKVKIRALAEHLDISRGAIAQWKDIPASRVREVAAFTGIPLQVLRPDLYADMEMKAAS